jgi:hypothetical protein
MADGWPGKWHSKTEDDSSMTNDNGLLLVTGETGEAYLWYESDGYDPHTEVRR